MPRFCKCGGTYRATESGTYADFYQCDACPRDFLLRKRQPRPVSELLSRACRCGGEYAPHYKDEYFEALRCPACERMRFELPKNRVSPQRAGAKTAVYLAKKERAKLNWAAMLKEGERRAAEIDAAKQARGEPTYAEERAAVWAARSAPPTKTLPSLLPKGHTDRVAAGYDPPLCTCGAVTDSTWSYALLDPGTIPKHAEGCPTRAWLLKKGYLK